jgi:hypothetical protein
MMIPRQYPDFYVVVDSKKKERVTHHFYISNKNPNVSEHSIEKIGDSELVLRVMVDGEEEYHLLAGAAPGEPTVRADLYIAGCDFVVIGVSPN